MKRIILYSMQLIISELISRPYKLYKSVKVLYILIYWQFRLL